QMLRELQMLRGARQTELLPTAYCLGLARPAQLELQVRFGGGPLGGDDAVDAGVAQGAVGGELMAAQDAVELGAEPLDAGAGLAVEEVGAEPTGDAAERLEGMAEQEQLAARVEVGPLHRLAVPGRADLHALVGGVDVHVGGHAYRAAHRFARALPGPRPV